MGCGPLAGRIGVRRELRRDVGRGTEGGVVQRGQVLHHGARRGFGIDGVEVPILFGGGVQLVGVGMDEAGVGREPLATDEALSDASGDDVFKDLPEQVAVAEPSPLGDARIACRAAHAGSSKRWSDPGSGRSDRAGRTTGTPD